MENRLELRRIFDDVKQIRGYLSVLNQENKVLEEFVSLELPWKDNERNISCIPTGTYQIIKDYSDNLGYFFRLLNVPNRSGVLIHVGNFYTQIEGCIIAGMKFKDINKDGLLDVSKSTQSIRQLLAYMPDKSTITIS